MKEYDFQPLVLGDNQEAVLERLAQTLQKTHLELRAAGMADSLSVYRGEEFANVFGIVGPRGAGKSTLLTQLIRDRQNLLRLDNNPVRDSLRVITPLDCSTVPDGIEPGMAILLHLWNELQPKPSKDSDDVSNETNSRRKSLEGQYKKLVSTYLWSLDAYRDLELDLASSPQSFASDLIQDTSQRMTLRRDLAKWLADLLEAYRHEAVVLLLDDFDLIHAKLVRKWFNCLLDEFHQANLYVILTGDFHRLEHLIFDHEAEIDDKTARAQLEKLLPLHQRVYLDPWSGTARKDWPPHASEGNRLRDLIKDVDPRIDSRLLCHLLPNRPRGLGSFYRNLARQKDAGESQTGPLKIRALLADLATCRGEPLLSRHLLSQGAQDWASLFGLVDDEISLEDWNDSVRAAKERSMVRSEDLSPIPGLALVPRHRPGNSSESPDLERKGPSSRSLYVETSAAAESQDPLRHEWLWHAPLRDTDEEVEPFWAELLLDLSFTAERDSDPGWPVRNRVSFLNAWRPARERLGKAQVDLERQRSWVRPALLRFAFDYQDLDLYSLLSWVNTQPEGEDRIHLRLGWPILFEALRQGHLPFESILFSDLDLDFELILRNRPVESAVAPWDSLGVLPSRLWAKILLVDAIDRCPWSVVSSILGWHLPTYLVFAAASLHGAYLHALKVAGFLEDVSLSDSQKQLVEGLERRDPSWILFGDSKSTGSKESNRYETSVFDRLSQVLSSDLPGMEANPLEDSARRFFDLPPYRAVQAMAKEGLYI